MKKKRKVVSLKEKLFLIVIILFSFFLLISVKEKGTNKSYFEIKTFGYLNKGNSLITGSAVGDLSPTSQLGLAQEANASSCGSVNGNLTLTADLTTTGTCFTINATNITLDCAGHTIQGDRDTSDYGVDIPWPFHDVIIKNCRFESFGIGIRVDANNLFLKNNSLYHNIKGITIIREGTKIENNYFFNNTYGLEISSRGDNLRIINNTFVEGLTAIYTSTTIDFDDVLVDNNEIYNTTDYGIYIVGNYLKERVNFTNNYIYNTGDTAVYLRSFDIDLYFYNNTIEKGGDSSTDDCLYLDFYSDALNGLFVGNSFLDCPGDSLHFAYVGACSNLEFINNTIDPEARIYYDQDCPLYFIDNNFNKSKIDVSGARANSQVFVQWSVEVKTLDSSNNPLEGVNVSFYNVTGNLIYNNLTNSEGTLPPQRLTEFWQDVDDNKYYESPYNLSGEKSGYQANSTLVNLTETETTTVTLVLSSLNNPPQVTQLILNASSLNNYTTDDLTCYAEVDDIDGDEIYVNYTWYNDSLIFSQGQVGPVSPGILTLITNLTSDKTKKGDLWRCSLRAYDGQVYEETEINASLLIRNTPPTITLPLITPSPAYTNDTLKVKINYTDADKDPGEIYFSWYVEGSKVHQQINSSVSSSQTIESTLGEGNFSKHNQINVSVYAFDGEDNSSLVWSEVLVISDSPPSPPLLEEPPQGHQTTNNTPFFQWTPGSDKDNDPLTYEILIAEDPLFEKVIQIGENLENNTYAASVLADGHYYWKVKTITSEANSSYTSYRNLTIDTTPPYLSHKNFSFPSVYSPTNSSYFNLSWQDFLGVAEVYLESNFSGVKKNYTLTLVEGNASQGKYLFSQILPAGNFYWKAFAKDILGNKEETSLEYFSIAKAPALLSLYLNQSQEDFQGEINFSLIISCNLTQPPEGNLALYEGETLLNSSFGSEVKYKKTYSSLGEYNLTCRLLDHQNYTGSDSSLIIAVDKEPPFFKQAINTSPSFQRYANFTAEITVMDNVALVSYLFSTNASGNWFNTSLKELTGTQEVLSEEAEINLSQGNQVCWFYWAQDSSGNENRSPLYCFWVNNSPPVFDFNLTKQEVKEGETFFYDINCSDFDEEEILYYDNTSLFEINSTTGLIKDQPSVGEAGSYVIEIICSDGKINTSQEFTYVINRKEETVSSSARSRRRTTKKCLTDEDCQINQYCLNYSCYDYECLKKEDCPPEEYCWNHHCVKLFDLKITQVDSPLSPGEFLDFLYYIKAMANVSGDVTFKFWVEDKNKKKIVSGSDIVFIGDFEEKIEKAQLFLPTDVQEGKYKFLVQLNFENYQIESYRWIEVKKEAPLHLSLTLFTLPEIKAETPWNFSFLLAINKDKEENLLLERKITREDTKEIVWFKKETLKVNRSRLLTDKIKGLKEGEYSLEIKVQKGEEISKATELFEVKTKEPLQKPLFGQAIKNLFGQRGRDYSLLWITFLSLSFLTGFFFWLKKKRGSKETILDPLGKLESWVRLAQEKGFSEEEIRKRLEDFGWREEEQNIVFRRLEAEKILKEIYSLKRKKIKELRNFILAEKKRGQNKERVMKKLEEGGWLKEVIEDYVTSYFN